MRRAFRTDTPLMATVPLTDYAGVAVRMAATNDGDALKVFVELLHNDPSLTVRLAVASEPETVVADWQAWGRVLGLSLLIVGQDGSVSEPLTEIGGLVANPAKSRRQHTHFAERRPRFLARRKKGGNRTEQISGREIIARD